MTQKLFAFVNGECAAESPDNPMFQEVLLPGHLLQMVLKVNASLSLSYSLSLTHSLSLSHSLTHYSLNLSLTY